MNHGEKQLYITGLRIRLALLLFNFLVKPHGHKLGERDTSPASDSLSHGNIEWVNTQGYGAPRWAIGYELKGSLVPCVVWPGVWSELSHVSPELEKAVTM